MNALFVHKYLKFQIGPVQINEVVFHVEGHNRGVVYTTFQKIILLINWFKS
jgi:hypothetical protein